MIKWQKWLNGWIFLGYFYLFDPIVQREKIIYEFITVSNMLENSVKLGIYSQVTAFSFFSEKKILTKLFFTKKNQKTGFSKVTFEAHREHMIFFYSLKELIKPIIWAKKLARETSGKKTTDRSKSKKFPVSAWYVEYVKRDWYLFVWPLGRSENGGITD